MYIWENIWLPHYFTCTIHSNWKTFWFFNIKAPYINILITRETFHKSISHLRGRGMLGRQPVLKDPDSELLNQLCITQTQRVLNSSSKDESRGIFLQRKTGLKGTSWVSTSQPLLLLASLHMSLFQKRESGLLSTHTSSKRSCLGT